MFNENIRLKGRGRNEFCDTTLHQMRKHINYRFSAIFELSKSKVLTEAEVKHELEKSYNHLTNKHHMCEPFRIRKWFFSSMNTPMRGFSPV